MTDSGGMGRCNGLAYEEGQEILISRGLGKRRGEGAVRWWDGLGGTVHYCEEQSKITIWFRRSVMWLS